MDPILLKLKLLIDLWRWVFQTQMLLSSIKMTLVLAPGGIPEKDPGVEARGEFSSNIQVSHLSLSDYT